MRQRYSWNYFQTELRILKVVVQAADFLSSRNRLVSLEYPILKQQSSSPGALCLKWLLESASLISVFSFASQCVRYRAVVAPNLICYSTRKLFSTPHQHLLAHYGEGSSYSVVPLCICNVLFLSGMCLFVCIFCSFFTYRFTNDVSLWFLAVNMFVWNQLVSSFLHSFLSTL